jgi:hypothetical protein
MIPIVLFIMGGLTMIGYPIARALARRIEHKPIAPTASPELERRLDRIEQSIEAIAIEIERVSEGQRFTTKLLAEQRALPSAPDAARGERGREGG